MKSVFDEAKKAARELNLEALSNFHDQMREGSFSITVDSAWRSAIQKGDIQALEKLRSLASQNSACRDFKEADQVSYALRFNHSKGLRWLLDNVPGEIVKPAVANVFVHEIPQCDYTQSLLMVADRYPDTLKGKELSPYKLAKNLPFLSLVAKRSIPDMEKFFCFFGA